MMVECWFFVKEEYVNGNFFFIKLGQDYGLCLVLGYKQKIFIWLIELKILNKDNIYVYIRKVSYQ